eukprot:jgi/Hompol1/6646/HPOL_002877-RA
MVDHTGDIAAAAASCASLLAYHIWLAYTVAKHPEKTVYGLAAAARRIWIASIMYRKEEILAVQTLRNYIMAATVLATTSVGIVFGIIAFLSNVFKATSPANAPASSSPSTAAGDIASLAAAAADSATFFAFTTDNLFGAKVVLFIATHVAAFFFLTQSLRFYNHVAMIINVNITQEELAKLNYRATVAYEHLDANRVAKMMNRGSLFYTMAMRMYYFSFPLLAWFAGPWTMGAATLILLVSLRFLDFTSEGMPLHAGRLVKQIIASDEERGGDAASVISATGSVGSGKMTKDEPHGMAARNLSIEKPKGLKFIKREPQVSVPASQCSEGSNQPACLSLEVPTNTSQQDSSRGSDHDLIAPPK